MTNPTENFIIQPFHKEEYKSDFDNYLNDPNHPFVLIDLHKPAEEMFVYEATYLECLDYLLAMFPKSRKLKNIIKKAKLAQA